MIIIVTMVVRMRVAEVVFSFGPASAAPFSPILGNFRPLKLQTSAKIQFLTPIN